MRNITDKSKNLLCIFIIIILYIVVVIYNYFHTTTISDWIITMVISAAFLVLLLILYFISEKVRSSIFLLFIFLPLLFLLYAYLMDRYLTTEMNYAACYGSPFGSFLYFVINRNDQRGQSLSKLMKIILFIYYISLGYLMFHFFA